MKRTRKLSAHAVLLLQALAGQPQAWRYGYALSQETGLKSGTLYPLLIRLANQGMLESEWRPLVEVGRPPRHAYRLTSGGLAAARAHSAGTAPAPARADEVTA